MIPLVVLDLDGTMIGADGQVPACVWQKIDEVRAAGVKLAVSTGRPAFGTALRIAKKIGPTHPHVFQNGAQIAYPDGDTLHLSALREAVTRELIRKARQLSVVLELYTPSMLFVERKTPLSEAHAKMLGVNAIVRDLAEVAANEPVVRAQWVITAAERDAVHDLALDGVQVSTATAPALPQTLFISVTPAGVSKGSGVRALAEAMRLPLEQIMAVGDSVGDAPMLEAVGHPVVMGNAPDELKERFSFVVPDVDDCGVVAALDEALTRKAR